MKIALIAAMAENQVIGMNNKLPWKLPADLAWFKKNTLKKPIVMGRKTWESLPFRPLPGRDNIIITRDDFYQAKNTRNEVITTTFIFNSFAKAVQYASEKNYEELMCIGGASLYKQVLPQADCLYLTQVKGSFAGDAWFPEIDFSQWQESYHQENKPDKDNPHYYTFSIYKKAGVI